MAAGEMTCPAQAGSDAHSINMTSSCACTSVALSPFRLLAPFTPISPSPPPCGLRQVIGHCGDHQPPLRVFSILDALLARHSHVYKVETVGGEYMASAGVPKECPSSACAITAFAVEAMSKLCETTWASGVTVGARIGIHSGAVVAGIAGCKSPRYRLFGDVVNTASRMKDQASENQIMVSEAHVDKIKTSVAAPMSS